MSSNYHILCMNHDPAIVIDGGWQRPDHAIDAVRQRNDDQLKAHASCDLLVGRYSYPLIEVCCPGCNRWGMHVQPEWVGVAWLRLLYAVLQSQDQESQESAKRITRGCWSPDRVHRLRVELGIEGGEGS